jgi:hypothetical protein
MYSEALLRSTLSGKLLLIFSADSRIKLHLVLFGSTQYNTIYWDHVEQMTTLKKPGKMTRAILRSDLNVFYASVELMLDPNFRGKPVAVCDSTEERHGIVLKRSEPAKKAGIKTSMVNWEARKLCPKLIMVPP